MKLIQYKVQGAELQAVCHQSGSNSRSVQLADLGLGAVTVPWLEPSTELLLGTSKPTIPQGPGASSVGLVRNAAHKFTSPEHDRRRR